MGEGALTGGADRDAEAESLRRLTASTRLRRGLLIPPPFATAALSSRGVGMAASSSCSIMSPAANSRAEVRGEYHGADEDETECPVAIASPIREEEEVRAGRKEAVRTEEDEEEE